MCSNHCPFHFVFIFEKMWTTQHRENRKHNYKSKRTTFQKSGKTFHGNLSAKPQNSEKTNKQQTKQKQTTANTTRLWGNSAWDSFLFPALLVLHFFHGMFSKTSGILFLAFLDVFQYVWKIFCRAGIFEKKQTYFTVCYNCTHSTFSNYKGSPLGTYVWRFWGPTVTIYIIYYIFVFCSQSPTGIPASIQVQIPEKVFDTIW